MMWSIIGERVRDEIVPTLLREGYSINLVPKLIILPPVSAHSKVSFLVLETCLGRREFK